MYCIHPVFRSITCSDLDLWPLIPKANQHIDEPKYICDQNWVKFPSLGCEIWPSQGFRVIAWCDLYVWLFDLVSMSKALIHTSPSFGEISWNIYANIVFTQFSGHCLLWPWHLTFWHQKLISTSMNSNTSVTKIGGNFIYRFYPNVTTLPSGLCYRKSVSVCSLSSAVKRYPVGYCQKLQLPE